MDEEERKKSLTEKLKTYLDDLKERCDYLGYATDKARKLDLNHVYEREDHRTLEDLGAWFGRLYDTITGDFFVVISILSDIDVHWTNQERFYFVDMKDFGLIDSVELWEKIKKHRRTIAGDFIMYDRVKHYETIYEYTETLYKTASRLETFVKEKFLKEKA